MKKHAPIVVNLQSPREKYWGIMLSIDGAGVNVKGIDLNSFEDWIREVAKGEGTMGLSTVFFPMHRVERIGLDENIGEIKSQAAVFESRVGTDVWTHLGLSKPEEESE